MGKRRPQTAEKQRDQTENSIPHTQTHNTHSHTSLCIHAHTHIACGFKCYKGPNHSLCRHTHKAETVARHHNISGLHTLMCIQALKILPGDGLVGEVSESACTPVGLGLNPASEASLLCFHHFASFFLPPTPSIKE